MPRTKLSEYSTTNSSNTDIEGINIDEGCAPSGINNAIRELMVHLKEFQTGASGDAFTFAGGVLISGTANTITGNVLMSGTNTITGSTTATFAAGAVGTPSIAAHGDTNTGIFFPAADTIAFAEGGAEAMRIDSDGDVGIGTSAPANKLHVSQSLAGSASSSAGIVRIANTRVNTGDGASTLLFVTDEVDGNTQDKRAQIGAEYDGSNGGRLVLSTAQTSTKAMTERMRIDSSGNVGIGTSSPSTYGKFVTYSSGGYAVINTDGQLFSYQLLDVTTAGGRLTGGSSQGVLGSVGIEQTATGAKGGYIRFNTCASGTNTQTERARITSDGYFKAADNGTYNSSTDAYHEFNQSAQNIGQMVRATNGSYNSSVLDIRCSRAASADYYLIVGRSSNGSDTEFYITGAGNAYADGTWNNNGADYAEFFESANGQALTLGATVVLDGNKVREATSQDPASAIIGVVRPKEPSKASMVVGNTAWNKWANKYLTDDFDRYIMGDHDVVEWEEQVLEREAVEAVEAVVDEEGNEVSPAIPAQEAVYKTKQHSYESHNIPADVTVPADAVRKTHDDKGNKFQHYKLNPAWDKDAEYVNRENRPEWNIIGLLGQVKILKGQPVGDRWIKMRDVSATVEEWMIR